MAMKHTYATGAALGVRAQYADIGGTDSLDFSAADNTGTVSVITNSSSYGTQAIQLVTSANTGEPCRIQSDATQGVTAFRAHWVVNVPAFTAGQWLDTANTYANGTEVKVSFNADGAFQLFINGTNVYDSGNGVVPAAGTKVRFSWAQSLTTWRVAFYNDDTNTVLASGAGTTSALAGTFDSLFLGKVAYQSGNNLTLQYRAIRVETGAGTGTAVLPQESLLTPAKGSSVVPIRLVSTSGSTPNPTGASAITNLADGSTSTTVNVQAASGIRMALRPMAVVSTNVTFLLPAAFADSSTVVSVKLWKQDGSQIGSTKTVTIGTSAATASVVFTAAELSGLASGDWEAIEIELLVP